MSDGKAQRGLLRPLHEDYLPTANGYAGANTLLAYFHYCNKGIYPFSTECKDQDLQSLAELDDDGVTFVKYTRQYVSDYCKQNPVHVHQALGIVLTLACSFRP